MAETERAKTIRQATERTKALKKEYGVTTPPTAGATTTPTIVAPKKKKSTVRSVIERIKKLLGIGKKGTTIPSGVRTPEQIKEYKEIMEATK